ncbi:hypothetical protein D0851_02230 [Marinobacter sp. Arc7-DN-1]|nr:hypothetical protein D0851_02230 [Marinobacter sp. Arc7-DN-1]
MPGLRSKIIIDEPMRGILPLLNLDSKTGESYHEMGGETVQKCWQLSLARRTLIEYVAYRICNAGLKVRSGET